MLRRVVPLAAWLAGAFLAGCADRPASDADKSAEVPRPATAEGVFLMAVPRVRESPIPERFTRELPARVADFEAQAADYPLVHVRKKLCAGDAEVLGRFSRAVNAAAAAGDDLDALRRSYGSLLEWCGRPELCAWAARTVDGDGAAAELAWAALPLCGGHEVEALFERLDAPAATVVEYWSTRYWRDDFVPRWRPALASALGEVARAGDARATRQAADLVSRSGTAAAEPLVALHDELPPGEPRDAVAASLGALSHPRAQEIFREYCARAERDLACRTDPDFDEGTEDPAEPPAAPVDGELEEKLRSLGLFVRGPLPGTENWLSGAHTPAEVLKRSGPVHCFDVETDQHPNEHDALLYDLAELAGPPLDRAVFEEEPPPREDEKPYRLRAYLDGRAYETDAENFGDWYDLDRVLGLLNAMAADQGAAARVVALPTDDQTACVLAAPREAILAGIEEGLLELGDAGDAMDAGKEFEDEVMRKLREAVEAGADDGT
jgi:hypothetical protein